MSDIPMASDAESINSMETVKVLRSKKVQRKIVPREEGEISSDEDPAVMESTRKSLGITTESEPQRPNSTQRSIGSVSVNVKWNQSHRVNC